MRIVSLVPSLTELLYDLGLSDEVVGITKFCVHPSSWHASKTRVGGTKNVHVDVVAGLRPDLVIASREENVREQVEAIGTFTRVYVTDIASLRDVGESVKEIGRLVGKETRALEIDQKINHEFAMLQYNRFDGVVPPPAPIPAAYFIWRDPWMVAGGDTFINAMMECAGFVNVYKHLSRYPTVDPAEVHGLALLSTEPYPFMHRHAAELPHAQAVFVDGEMFSWYGSRLLLAPDYFRDLVKHINGTGNDTGKGVT